MPSIVYAYNVSKDIHFTIENKCMRTITNVTKTIEKSTNI